MHPVTMAIPPPIPSTNETTSAEAFHSGPSEPKSFEVVIVDGTIIGRDMSTGQQWQINGLSGSAKPLPSGGWDVLVILAGLLLTEPALCGDVVHTD